ncbi:MAG: hypothetical protein GAK30_02973 [Paracidovorax wautersii]|uniref:Uncharacterized protein n=1 Tax=Paracidovorax wautersii TaxID=1177982 RepID=A0A7V8FLX9_9BURK|nr:MAG: hypothetical protein GAK30_02973 [Paracidovorax wautersii]
MIDPVVQPEVPVQLTLEEGRFIVEPMTSIGDGVLRKLIEVGGRSAIQIRCSGVASSGSLAGPDHAKVQIE